MAGFEQPGSQEKVEVINELLENAETLVKICEGKRNLASITLASNVLNSTKEKISNLLQEDLSEDEFNELVNKYNALADRQQIVADEYNAVRKAK